MPDLSALSPSARKRYVLIERIIIKRGNSCFFCHETIDNPLTSPDCTIEHINPKSRGGRTTISNLWLAHKSCNKLAGSAPIKVKYFIRTELEKTGRRGWGYVRALIKKYADGYPDIDKTAEAKLKTWGLEL